MKALMQRLSEEQQVWLVDLAVAAIWADGEITMPEFENFSRLVSCLNDPLQKKLSVKKLEDRKVVPVSLPEGLPKEVLPVIYQEIMGIMICDWILAEEEKDLLEQLSDIFGFTKMYRAKLIHWAEEGMAWQEEQRYLLPKGITLDDSRVPLHEMDGPQKVWYAEALISAIMIDGLIDEIQMRILKRAMVFIDNPKEVQRLIGYVKNKLRPSLLSPPGLNNETIYQIFFEILRVISTNELSSKELVFIGDYARVCNMPQGVEDQAVDWLKKGITWRQKKKSMTEGAAFDNDGASSLAKSEDRWLDHPVNNSLTYRDQACWFCEEDFEIKVYRLRPKSQKPMSNLFGIPYYKEPMTKADHFLDFNRIRISLCPRCLFASPAKEMFKPKTGGVKPKVFGMREFQDFWRKGLDGRKTAFEGLLKERDPLKSNLSEVKSLYRVAIQGAEALKQFDPVGLNQWAPVSLKLTLAEILMGEGQPTEAEKILFEAEALAQKLQTSTRENRYSLMSARLLFMIALYKGDKMAAGGLLNFFLKLKDEKFASMTQEEKSQFSGMLGGVKRDFEDREELVKTKLEGFRRKAFVSSSASEQEG